MTPKIIEDLIIKFRDWSCMVQVGKYPKGGHTFLHLLDSEDGSPICTASVNVPEVNLDKGQIIIKDYSENEGVYQSLVDAGVISETWMPWPLGWVEGKITDIVHSDILECLKSQE